MIIGLLIFFGIPALAGAAFVWLVSATEDRDVKGLPIGVIAAGCAVGGAASAAAWLTWEVGFTRYPTGTVEGPYAWWQIVGTGLCAVAVCVAGTVLARKVWTGAAAATVSTTIGYAVAWASIASQKDSSGMFMVGALFLMAGAGLGLGLCALLVAGVRGARLQTASGSIG